MKKNILFLLSLILCIDLCAQRISLSNNSPSVNYTKGLKCIDNNENEKGIALIRLAAGKGYLTAQEYRSEERRLGTGWVCDG